MGSPSCNPTFMMPRQVPPVSSLVNGRRDEPDEVGIGRWIQVVPWFRLSDPFLAYNWRSKISAPCKFGDVPIWLMGSFFFCILFAMMFPTGKCFSWALKRRRQWLDPSCTLGVSRSSCGKWPSCRTPWCSRLRVHAPSERWPDQMHHYLDLLSLCFYFQSVYPVFGESTSLFFITSLSRSKTSDYTIPYWKHLETSFLGWWEATGCQLSGLSCAEVPSSRFRGTEGCRSWLSGQWRIVAA